jgi:hypothetical protein
MITPAVVQGDIPENADQIKDQAEPLTGTYVSSSSTMCTLHRHFGDTVTCKPSLKRARRQARPSARLARRLDVRDGQMADRRLMKVRCSEKVGVREGAKSLVGDL